MNAGEVVISKVQAQRGPVVLPLLAEAIGQPRKAPDLHSHGEVLALDVRRADSGRIGITHNWDYLRGNHFGRRITRFPCDRGAIDLDELSKVHAIRKGVFDGRAVRHKAVRGDVETLRSSGVP